MDDASAYALCREATRSRAQRLPSGVWDCEVCGGTDSMAVRSSHLNGDVYADDITFKCLDCYHVRTHGVPFEKITEYHEERECRPGTIVDFGMNASERDTASPEVADRLEALGYLARAESLRSD